MVGRVWVRTCGALVRQQIGEGFADMDSSCSEMAKQLPAGTSRQDSVLGPSVCGSDGDFQSSFQC